MEEVDKQAEIRYAYAEIISQKNNRPVYADFIDYDITRDAIRTKFGGIEKLHDYMDANHPELIDKYFLSVEKAFSQEKELTTGTKKKYIVTTAVADSEPHLGFLASLDLYAKLNDAQLVIMPCESKTNSFENKTAVFDKIFSDPKYLFVNKDIELNSNISLCSIQVSAKQIRPISGLARIGNREGSFVFASTKQFLEFVPSGNKRGTNFSIMTTGACTLPSYYSERFASKRISYIAEKDHIFGAVIIEIEDDKTFHFRQIQADAEGSFIDLGEKYSADGPVTTVNTNIVFGDLHSVDIDMFALSSFIDKFKNLAVDKVFLHDIFDGHSVNHHIANIKERTERAHKFKTNLEEELSKTFEVLEFIDNNLNPVELVIVKSNHDEFLSRYLAEGRYVSDPENHYAALNLAIAMFDHKDVIKAGFEFVGAKVPDNWTFLNRSSSYKIGGVECGSHGDLGLNGAKPSLTTLEKVYGDCVIGHNHTAAIHRGVFRVGTISKLDLGYNRGPNSWTQTCALIYENGQKQLINLINNSCGLNV